MNSEIASLIREAGVVGAGGAGFPTHVKASSRAELVIINGAECEPLLRVDQQLMGVAAAEVVRGLEAMMAATGASGGVIALKGKYTDAYQALERAIAGKPVRLFQLGDFFPAGDEQVLVYEVTGRVVPEGGIPLQAGCVVSNVETLLNVARALDGIPVTDKYVTVTGAVPRPGTFRVPVGTLFADVLALAGAKEFEDKVVIDGGPMMGQVVRDFTRPVTKVTKGLILLPGDHPLVQKKILPMEHIVRQAKAACIQCIMCTDICPRYLLGHGIKPHQVMRSLNYQVSPDSAKVAMLCCECGACELYACPMQLSPRQVNAAIKKELARQGVKPTPAERPGGPWPVREYRKIPSKRLVARLELARYDLPAPLRDTEGYPREVRIPLRQHIGVPSLPLVQVGQRVRKGDLLAGIPEGALGAKIHASISGTIREISDWIVIESDRERGDQG